MGGTDVDLVVRHATATDIDGPDGLDALRTAIIAELAGERGGPLFLADRADRTTASLLEKRPEPSLCEVVAFEGSLLGWSYVTVRTLTDGRRVGTVEELAVDHGARAIGAGEALLDSALAWCRAQGCTGVDSFALPGARETKNFFETFGLKARLLTVHVDFD